MASQQERSVTISERLAECGLEPDYWSGILKGAFDITSLDEVGKLSQEHIDKLLQYKQSESDIEGLNRFIASSRNIAERSVTISERLAECGLEPDYWSGILKGTFDITSLDEVGKLSQEHIDKLLRYKLSESDIEALNRFIASSKNIAETSITIFQKLVECKLDHVYWTGVLKGAFDINSHDQVGKLSKVDPDRLVNFKRFDSEREALDRFIVSSQIRNIGLIERQINRKQKLDRVKLLLNELCELNAATETRSVSDLKNKADDLCKALGISQNNWLKEYNQTAVATAIASLSADLKNLEQFLSTHSNLNIGNVLNNASDGLLLRGILLNDDQREYQRSTEKLLSASCQPRITILDGHQETFEVVHSSTNDFQGFNKMLHMSGFNISSKNSEGISAADNEGHDSKDGTAKLDVHYSKTTCVLLPTTVVNFRETESFPLSNKALEELKSIDKLVAKGAGEQLLNSKCTEFLKVFGSHFHLDYVLGGILRLSVVYSNSLPSSLSHQAMVDMVNVIYNSILSSDFVGLLPPCQIEGYMNEEKMKMLGLGGRYVPSVLSKVALQVERFGGSCDVGSIPLWKASLGLGNDICSVVEIDPCAIWDLLTKNPSQEICHPHKLADYLMHVIGDRVFNTVINSKVANLDSDPDFAQNAIAHLLDPITHDLESYTEKQVASPTSNSPGSLYAEEPFPPAVEPQITHDLESYKEKQVTSPTSNPPGSLPAEGPFPLAVEPPITRHLESYTEKQKTSPTSNPLGSLSAEEPFPPAVEPPITHDLESYKEKQVASPTSNPSGSLSAKEPLPPAVEPASDSQEIRHPQKLADYLIHAMHVIGDRMFTTVVNSKVANLNPDPDLAQNAIAHSLDPITHDLESYEEKQVASPTYIPSGSRPAEESFPPAVEPPITHDLESYKEKQVTGPTSTPPGSRPAEELLPSAVEPPITHDLESYKKKQVASPTSNPSGSRPVEESFPPAVEPPIKNFLSNKENQEASPTSNLKEKPAKVPLSTPAEPLITREPNKEKQVTSPKLNQPAKGTIAKVPLSRVGTCRLPMANADKHGACHALLSLLCLKKFYPQKITLKQVVSITEGREEKDKLTLPDIPWVILKKLLMINYEGRNSAWERRLSVPDGTADQSDDDVDFLSGLADLDDDPEGNDIPHPTDIFIATFSCCDLMLRQVLLEKMTQCRLAVPLVMPGLMGTNPTLCKWALRSIVLEYCRRDNPSPGGGTALGHMAEFALVDCPMKVVSFVRIGEIPISKSQLLNGVLSAQSHHTFFNIESCSLGTSERITSSGMIEAAWYIPSTKDGGLFDDVTMFLNLRGDGSNFAQQARLISKMSSVVIVFVDQTDLDSDASVAAIRALYQNNQKFILVLTGTATRTDATRCFQSYGKKVGKSIMLATTKTIITTSKGKKQKTLIEIGHGIRQNLSDILKERSTKTYDQLSQFAVQHEPEISVDEHLEECHQGKAFAYKVVVPMEKTPVVKIKKEQLPIQKLWPEWSKLLKERNRTKGKSHETTSIQERETLLKKMKELRKKQGETRITPVLQTFSSMLIQLIDKPTTLHFFMQWLKLFFDKLSRDNLPRLRKEYSGCWAEYNREKSKSADKQLVQNLKLKLQTAENELAEASCGLEHLFREVGQLYEANKESKLCLPNEKLIVEKLPEVVARLLLLGHPIELMDGDAANVPMTWIRAVLTSLTALTDAKLCPKRVFVLSVLGIQSSGKSTLLNTMFGLRFAVSAGRCTRGVYAQLIEVDKAKTGLPFDYVLVVDTEGLRAPELSHDKYEHDNELATLAIGLGDMVIMNIKGENVSEIQDVLQIAVHAFLRMKRVELQQTCVFIHQNVAAANAAEKMAHGRQKLLDNLDKMTEQAAEQEQFSDVHSFNQIINIDADKCVWYFSDLWQGDPPMAPVNPGYSESVEKVRKCLLFDINMKKDFLSLQHLSTRINDLWQGILADDFVFSFRNTLAVKAYSALEDKYHELTWVCERDIMEWFTNIAHNKLERCETVDELDNATVTLIKDLEKLINDLMIKQKCDLENFFEENTLKDITIQWKDEKVNSIKSFAIDLLRRTKGEVNQKRDRIGFELRNNRASQEDMNKQILANASKLAEDMKGKSLTKEMLDSEFNVMWGIWLTLLAPPVAREEVSIQVLVESVLFDKLSTHTQHLNDVVHLLANSLDKTLSGTFIVNEGDINLIITMAHKIQNPMGHRKKALEKNLKPALDLTESVFVKIEAYLSNLISQGTTFLLAHATKVVKTVIDFVDNHNREDSSMHKFKFSLKYKVRLAVHVCRRAIFVFTSMRENYNEKHNLVAKLQIMKTAAFHLFINKVKNQSNEITAAELFCDRLAELTKQKIMENMAWKIYEDVYSEFSKKKYHLIVAILEDLVGRGGFGKDWGLFLSDSKTYALKWITGFINKRCFSPENREKNGSYASIAGSALTDVIKGISNSVEGASEHVRHSSHSHESRINEWLAIFCNEAEEYLAVREAQVKSTAEQGAVEDIDNFERLVLKRLDKTREHILKGFREETENVKWEGNTPYQLVMEKLWGCGAQCPFCKEPCQWTNADHCNGQVSHRCIQHRINGVGGVRWHKTCSSDAGHLRTASCGYVVQSTNTFSCRNQLPTCKGADEFHDYTMYKTYFPNWDIAPKPTMESSKFWMWFMAEFQQQLAEHYDAKEPKIPESWREITKEEALQSLREYE